MWSRKILLLTKFTSVTQKADQSHETLQLLQQSRFHNSCLRHKHTLAYLHFYAYTDGSILYENLTLANIIPTKVKLQLFISCKKEGRKCVFSFSLSSSRNVHHWKTHILCHITINMQAVVSETFVKSQTQRETSAHIYITPHTPFLSTAVLGSGNTGEQRYLSPKDPGCGRSAEAACFCGFISHSCAQGVLFSIQSDLERCCYLGLHHCWFTETLLQCHLHEHLLSVCAFVFSHLTPFHLPVITLSVSSSLLCQDILSLYTDNLYIGNYRKHWCSTVCRPPAGRACSLFEVPVLFTINSQTEGQEETETSFIQRPSQAPVTAFGQVFILLCNGRAAFRVGSASGEQQSEAVAVSNVSCRSILWNCSLRPG